MRNVSPAYQEAIQLHRSRGVRNQMHAEISLGIFAEGAKEDSTFTISPGVPISDANNMYYSTTPITSSYALWEKDCFRLDAVQTFIPSSGLKAQGYISREISGADGTFSNPVILSATFGRRYSLVGLSFLFDTIASLSPMGITIRAYDDGVLLETVDITNSGNSDFKPEARLDEFNRIEIEFRTKPYQRVHLNSVLYGIGYIYTDAELVGLKNNRKAHPLSLEIPQTDLEFTVYNRDNRFDIDSDTSIVRFFEEGQEVTLRYGYDISGVGDIEWIAGGLFYLQTWEVKGYQATFKCKDIFYKLTQSTFDKGVFAVDSRTLSDLAIQVLQDAGVSDYYASEYLMSRTYSYLPLPYTSHSECLQLIASVATSTLGQDDTGSVVFRQQNIVPPDSWYVLLRSSTQLPEELPFSDIRSIVSSEEKVEYATWEQDFFRVDEDMCFIPEEAPYLPSGVVLNIFPDASGNYYGPGGGRPYLFIDFTQNRTFGGAKIQFSKSDVISNFWIRANRSYSGFLWDKNFKPNSGELEVNTLFDNVVWLSFFVYQNNRNHRLRIKDIKIERPTGLALTEDDILNSPNQELTAAVKSLSVQGKTVWFYPPPYRVELMRTSVTPGITNVIKHSEVYYRVVATCEDPNVIITKQDHYAYVSYIEIQGTSSDAEIILSGGEYAQETDIFLDTSLHDTGEDAIIQNSLLDSNQMASAGNRMLTLASDYYNGRNIYKINVLGYPECDAGDYITYNGKEVVVLENSIEMNGGAMRGKMKLRGGGQNSVADTQG